MPVLTPKRMAQRKDSSFASDVNACVVTDWSTLAKRLKAYLGDQIRVRNRLADLIGEKDCQVFIVDTKVNDINSWPAPILLEPSARHKLWLFLLGGPGDASFLNTPPDDCAFFERNLGAPDLLASYLRKRFDPDSKRRIQKVEYVEEARAFLVRMANGRSYALRIDELPEVDSSGVARWRIGRGRYYFSVTQGSGNSFDVPWDDVLHHCEPEYEYYKGKQKDASGDRAATIGGRVRALRMRKGLSVTELAGRAGMKRPNLSRLESGRHMPSLDTLERVADALEVPVAALVSPARTEKPQGE